MHLIFKNNLKSWHWFVVDFSHLKYRHWPCIGPSSCVPLKVEMKRLSWCVGFYNFLSGEKASFFFLGKTCCVGLITCLNCYSRGFMARACLILNLLSWIKEGGIRVLAREDVFFGGLWWIWRARNQHILQNLSRF